MNRYLDAALIACESLVVESGEDVAEIPKGCWYRSDAANAQRCLESQFAILQTAKRNAAYLDTLDCVITFAELLNEHCGNAAPMVITALLNRAYDQLSQELKAQEKSQRTRKKTRVAKLAA